MRQQTMLRNGNKDALGAWTREVVTSIKFRADLPRIPRRV
jgi:hypothetical protein